MNGQNFDHMAHMRRLEQQNERLRNTLNTNRNSDGARSNSVDFQAKYKKALKQIYQVIQANKQLKQQLDKYSESRHNHESSISEARKDQIHKIYDSVLRQKNELVSANEDLQLEKQRLIYQLESLEAEMNLVKNERNEIAQQKQAIESESYMMKMESHQKPNQNSRVQQLTQKLNQKDSEYQRTIQTYEHSNISLTKQNKKHQERIRQLQQKLILSQKNWNSRFSDKDAEFKQLKTNVRHEYQDQINNLRKQINSLKLLNNQLMTKLQTSQMDYHSKNEVTQYEMNMLNSLKELRIQMQPMKKQIIDLQDMNSFDTEQNEREKTSLTMKVYELESEIQRYKITIKNQEDKIIKYNEQIQKFTNNEQIIKKLEEDNKMLGGRVIVLEAKDITIENRNSSSSLEENILEFQTRVEMLLNDKENIATLKNVSVHQLVALKAYIVQLDQKLKGAGKQNEYAVKKYKSYKDKFLHSVKEIKQHQMLENTLKTKILGYDKLVQKLQNELQKNVNMSQMQIMNIHSKTTQEMTQIQMYKKKYDSLKEKLVLQQRYNKQQLETIKLNYQTKMVDLSMKAEETNGLKDSIRLYREKNEQLTERISQKQNELLELRLTIGKSQVQQKDNNLEYQQQFKEVISSLQQTISKQENHIFKLQSEHKSLEQANRKRITTLEKQLQEVNGDFNRVKLVVSSKGEIEKNMEDISAENKRLKNKILELQNEIILIRNQQKSEENSGLHDLEFRLSALELEKNEFQHKLQTEISIKRRLEKQVQELSVKYNQLDADSTQNNMQNGRKIQELKNELADKKTQIENLEQQIRRQKITRKNSVLEMSGYNSTVPKEDHTLCQNKIQRLERQIKELQHDNQQLRAKINTLNNSTASINYEMENIKHDKDEAYLKIEKLEKQLINLKRQANIEEELYEKNRQFSQLKSEMNEERSKFQDEIFQRQRVISQLRVKVEYAESNSNSMSVLQTQFNSKLSQRDREISQLKSELNGKQHQLQQSKQNIKHLNETISKYTQQLTILRENHQTSSSQYAKRMEETLEEKQKLLVKFREQNYALNEELNQKIEQINLKEQNIKRIQRQLNECRQYEQECEKLRRSLGDRQTLVSKSKFDLVNLQQETERLKKEHTFMKQTLQKLKFDMIEKDDDLSKTKLQLSTLQLKLTNQLQMEFTNQLMQKDGEISRLTSQIHSLKNNYSHLQSEFNELESKERKLQSDISYSKVEINRLQQENQQYAEKLYKREQQFNQANTELTSLKFLQGQLTEKNALLSKLKSQISELKIDNSHLVEQASYKDGNLTRLNSELNHLRQQAIQIDHTLSQKDEQIRKLSQDLATAKSNLDSNVFEMNDKELVISRLKSQVQKIKNEHRQLQEEVQEREQQWNNLNFELNQAKNKIVLAEQQVQAKQMTIAKHRNEVAFLKQQLTRLNQEIVEKNHQINRINQLLFTQKMQLTNQINEQTQSLSNEIFNLKRQIESLGHTQEDLQSENRRLKIQLDGSRLRLNEQTTTYMYSEEDLYSLREENNLKYKKIMQQQLELTEKDAYIENLTEKYKKMEKALLEAEQSTDQRVNNLQQEVQGFVQKQRYYQSQFSQIQQTLTRFESDSNLKIQGFIQKEAYYQTQISELQQTINQRQSQYELKIQEFIDKQKYYQGIADQLQENMNRRQQKYESQVQMLQRKCQEYQMQISEFQGIQQQFQKQSELVAQFNLQSSDKTTQLLQIQVQNHVEKQRNYQSKLQELQSNYSQLHSQYQRVMSSHQSFQDNIQALQHEIENFDEKEKYYQTQIIQLQESLTQLQAHSDMTAMSSGQNSEELKYGLKLYTEETDRLNAIIQQLNQQVKDLRLKLSFASTQQGRIQATLMTMVMTFAQIQSVRERMKLKQSQINEVRRSLIQVASSTQDLHSQRGRSSKYIGSLHEDEKRNENVVIYEDPVENQTSAQKVKQEGDGQEMRLEEADHLNDADNDNNELTEQQQQWLEEHIHDQFYDDEEEEDDQIDQELDEQLVQQQAQINLDDVQTTARQQEQPQQTQQQDAVGQNESEKKSSDVDQLNRLKQSGPIIPNDKDNNVQTVESHIQMVEQSTHQHQQHTHATTAGQHTHTSGQSESRVTSTVEHRKTISISYQQQQQHEVQISHQEYNNIQNTANNVSNSQYSSSSQNRMAPQFVNSSHFVSSPQYQPHPHQQYQPIPAGITSSTPQGYIRHSNSNSNLSSGYTRFTQQQPQFQQGVSNSLNRPVYSPRPQEHQLNRSSYQPVGHTINVKSNNSQVVMSSPVRVMDRNMSGSFSGSPNNNQLPQQYQPQQRF